MTRATEDARRLVSALQSAAAYDHPVADIRVTETHISWIILTGDFAYKVKKPVTLGFLDFSTLEKRKFFCEEELRLNRRYSPDLYLGVVPITGTSKTPHVAGDGEPFEYAVKMQQFPDEALFSRRLRANSVTTRHIDSLAMAIADFHARAAVARPDSSWGTADAVWAPVEENFRQLQISGHESRQIAEVRRWSETEFQRLRPMFALRKRDGFVRECHGDLHANNLLVLDDQVRMFDCVEFNENFRWVDVLSDLAFLCMDLADFGRADFAHRVRNRYLETTGDYAGLAVWRYYSVYRALVRAKVAAIRSRQATEPAQQQAAARDLDNYLALAERMTRPSAPTLFITHGPSGSGKSTLTEPLLEALGAIRIRSDVERQRNAADVPIEQRYALESRQRVYRRLAELVESVIAAGTSVIVDATFLSRAQRTEFRQLAARLSVAFVILDFRTPPEVLRLRIAHRRGDASEADLAVLHAQLASAEPLDDAECRCAMVIDTTIDDPLRAMRGVISAPAETGP
ncbi:MAG: AAA family ATPase [Planctomycetaceae bacterium]